MNLSVWRLGDKLKSQEIDDRSGTTNSLTSIYIFVRLQRKILELFVGNEELNTLPSQENAFQFNDNTEYEIYIRYRPFRLGALSSNNHTYDEGLLSWLKHIRKLSKYRIDKGACRHFDPML